MGSAAPPQELAESVATAVDAAGGARVIVVGSLPPSGRDLDLLVRAPEREQIERALTAAGLERKGSCFALFRGCSAYGAELIAAERFLGGEALEDLFVRALPLPGFTSLARPAPPHALLILARLMLEEGGLAANRRKRLERILGEDPRAWDDAREIAPKWGAEQALILLERAARDGRPIPLSARLRSRWPRAIPSRPRRGLLVGLSGIDGAGKSSQARWLADSLTALGIPVEVVWNDLLGRNRALELVAAAPKALLRLTGRNGNGMARYDAAPTATAEPAAGALRALWSLLVTFTGAFEQRLSAARSVARGRVTVFDRSPLDLAVRMEVLYRSAVGLQRRLIALAAPRPDLAFLLDIPPALSLQRKVDIWRPGQLEEQAMMYRTLAPRFGVRLIDGRRAPDEIAAELAREAWLALG